MMGNLNVESRTIFNRDNLDVLQKINNDCIDLVYLDPPFNKKKIFTAPIGSSAEGAEFSDIFRQDDIKDEWVSSIEFENPELYEYLKGVKTFSNTYNYCYLVYMAVRLIECKRILKYTGSIYFHCDPTMSHYIKIVMDCIFGEDNFMNEIVWGYRTGGVSKKWFGRKHDIILLYVKSSNHHNFNVIKEKSYNRDGKAYRFKGVEEYQDKEGQWYTMASMRDVWEINAVGRTSKERTGYPTQKPLKLLERIILASSNKSDVVLDPFCGCATACIAAEKLERKWIGIDISHKAYELVKERLEKEVPRDFFREEPHFQTIPPTRGDLGKKSKEQGFVYVIANAAWEGIYKVGVAKDVKRRLNSYQTSDPNRGYKLIKEFQTPHYRAIETYIHHSFSGSHEWVKADKDEIIAAIESEIKRLGR